MDGIETILLCISVQNQFLKSLQEKHGERKQRRVRITIVRIKKPNSVFSLKRMQ